MCHLMRWSIMTVPSLFLPMHQPHMSAEILMPTDTNITPIILCIPTCLLSTWLVSLGTLGWTKGSSRIIGLYIQSTNSHKNQTCVCLRSLNTRLHHASPAFKLVTVFCHTHTNTHTHTHTHTLVGTHRAQWGEMGAGSVHTYTGHIQVEKSPLWQQPAKAKAQTWRKEANGTERRSQREIKENVRWK